MRTILFAICLSAPSLLAADRYTFDLSPAENVSVPAGPLPLTHCFYTHLSNQIEMLQISATNSQQSATTRADERSDWAGKASGPIKSF
jgi:hypothetical protein